MNKSLEMIGDYVRHLEEENLELQQKIDKAIEYLEKFIPIDNDTIILRERQRDYLLEILGDKENG